MKFSLNEEGWLRVKGTAILVRFEEPTEKERIEAQTLSLELAAVMDRMMKGKSITEVNKKLIKKQRDFSIKTCAKRITEVLCGPIDPDAEPEEGTPEEDAWRAGLPEEEVMQPVEFEWRGDAGKASGSWSSMSKDDRIKALKSKKFLIENFSTIVFDTESAELLGK